MRDTIIARRALLAVAAIAAASAKAAAHAAVRHRTRAALATKARHIVALDAGHGGVDPGAISPHGLYEKTITLATAVDLARLLEATGRYRPFLTRSRDVFVPLRDRVAKARTERAELFLSIHADALPNTALRGLSVYTLADQASDSETAELARRENRDSWFAGLHLPRQSREIAAILFDLTRRDTANRSLRLARAVVDDLGRAVPLLERPQRSAAFVVLTAPDIPSALVELGCLSNAQDERLLPTPAYQRRLATALAHAIDDYFAGATSA